MSRIVLLKGGGDLATGIAHRLWRSGFQVVITELPQPTVIRRTVAFAHAVYAGQAEVENVLAVHVDLARAQAALSDGNIPVLSDFRLPEVFRAIKPWAVVDAILAKRNTGTALSDAALVIGVGPGFIAGVDAHAVIETMRGHDLGRVITCGAAKPNTGIPGEVGGQTLGRLLRSPCDGVFQGVSAIGDTVRVGQPVAYVNNQPVEAGIDGVLRGLLQSGLAVKAGMKVGDIDPRCCREHCFTISDKARSVGGGVLEALLWLGNSRQE